MTKADLASIRARSFMRLHHKARAVLALVPSNDNENPALSLSQDPRGVGAASLPFDAAPTHSPAQPIHAPGHYGGGTADTLAAPGFSERLI